MVNSYNLYSITYQPNPSAASLQHNFQIPSRIAEREFITEALKIYDEKALLKPLKDNSVVHSNEEALKQTFMNTLILTLHADIEPDFRYGECQIGRSSRWLQEVTNVSLSLLEKSEDEILSLEISDKYIKNQKTVREAFGMED
ncbi:6000_t:CDS:2 [Diversispora eburnea]|uniref:6000_t:CDS:1 n=1 Tax=Diversispora eburnea TaxID=1213867 RepID=A0A9N9FBW3_9GLOM|nr:6000_t:CDS:2 [Diversispora eburnea]